MGIDNNMQNKNILIRSKYSTPQHRYYRSVRYKVNANTTGISNFTPNRSMNPSFSHKKHTQARTDFTLNRTLKANNTQSVVNPEIHDQSFSVEIKKPYLDTWHKLLNSNKEPQPEQIPKDKGPRVYLPHIIEHQPSMFTALDPLPLPFAHIQQGIKELKGQLPAPKIEMAQIRADLKKIEGKIVKDVEQIKQTATQGFQKLRKMLRCDKVQYQESIMRFQRNCQSLRDKDAAFKQDFQSTKPRLDVLQDDIFSTRPFDLTSNPTLEHQFPQEYF